MNHSEPVPNISSLGKSAAALGGKLGGVPDLASVFDQIVSAADQWVKVVQEESTRREEIRAWESVQRERIIAHRELLVRGLELTFDERRENFRRLFDNLDAAMRDDNATAAASLLESITELAKSSPFKDLGDVELAVEQLKNRATKI